MGGLFGTLAAQLGRKSIRTRSLTDPAELWAELFGGRQSKAGPAVSWQTALEVATVLACCKVISEGISQVSWKLYRKAGSRVEVNDHPISDLIAFSPNDWQTSFEFRETIALHVILTGNAFVHISRRANGEVMELIPYSPGMVSVKRAADLTLSYTVSLEGGGSVPVPASDMWHLRGPSWSGWLGMDAVKLAREAIGLAIATEESQATAHRNGLQLPGTYSVEGTLTPEQHVMLKKAIKAAADAGDPMILDRGAKWAAQQMTNVDAQHLETRKHQVEEVCRAFRVMPIMVGQADKATTYASSEQMFLAHVVHTLMPWYQRIEQSANVNLLSAEERRQGYYTKFNPNALMRGAAKDRAEFYAKALGAGGQRPWMTQDEVRELEEMDPYGAHAAELGTGAMDGAGQQPASEPKED